MGGFYSKLIAIPKFITIGVPLLAAFVIDQFSFTALFAVAILLFAASIIPLIPLRSEKTNFVFSRKRALEIYKKNKHFVIPEIIDNLAEDATVLWSVLVFIELQSVLHIGGISTVIGIASVFFTLSIGKLTDSWNKHRLLKIGAVGVVLAWVLNFFIIHLSLPVIYFYIGAVLMSLILKTFLIPYSTLMYNQARKDDAQFLVLREIPTILGRQILFVLALLFVHKLEITFLVVAGLFLFFVFYNTKKLEQA